MNLLKIHLALLAFCSLLANPSILQAQLPLDDSHIEVTLRMIGHQMLLQAGDSTSRLLPIQNHADTYQLDFEPSFRIQPEELVQLVDSLVTYGNIAQGYQVEIEKCDTREVVYSFEMGQPGKTDIVPCRGRELPVNCYSLVFKILEYPMAGPPASPSQSNLASSQPGSDLPIAISAALLLALSALWFYLRRKPQENEAGRDLITLGAYGFDTLNMELKGNGMKTELTAKENDLLLLLYKHSNTTVEREVILNKVWGDEGDYVGRTLDVFISKLRKKLEADPSLKILNVRGVGYKLVVNG